MTVRKFLAISFSFIAGLSLLPTLAKAAAAQAPHAQVELVADTTTIVPGQDATLAVRFMLEPDWHIYWRNPGDSGAAPSIEWTLPAGFTVSDIQWPTPQRISFGPLTNFGYDGVALLPVILRTPGSLTDHSVDIKAHARWLVCDAEECIPGSASLSLDLPIGPATIPSATSPELAAIHDRITTGLPSDWHVTASATADTLTLIVRGAPHGSTSSPTFFPYSRELIEPAAPQPVTQLEDGFQLSLRRWTESTTFPPSVDGVLAIGDRSYAIAVPIATSSLPIEPLIFAFLGGLLLNLMPCVLPVLTFKALALIGLAGEGRRRARRHGLIYGFGVLVSFWFLAGVLLIARAGGEQIGWGFQLQSPMVIALLAALFFWMALLLLGVSSVGGSIMGLGNSLTVGDNSRSAFFTGVLATVVATPCTAPFMGTALGYALGQPPAIAFAVFTSLGLGLAMPYVLLTFTPALINYLPRPGHWMETLKELLAFPLLATVVWLVWVASLQGGPTAVFGTLTMLLGVAFAAWATARVPARWSRVGIAGSLTAVLLLGAALLPKGSAKEETSWEPYSTARMTQLLDQGHPVFVDFTAAWCVTCQLNERLALETGAVMKKMRDLGVVLVRADWTRSNPDITRALQQFGRDGVPLYVLYSGRQNDPPRILPQLLTSETVITELDKLANGRTT